MIYSNFVNELEKIRKRPGMYFIRPTLNAYTAFVMGLDFSTNGDFLKGFQEWLVIKAKGLNNLHWPAIIPYFVVRKNNDILINTDDTSGQEELIKCAYQLIFEFVNEREKSGLAAIMEEYQKVLKNM